MADPFLGEIRMFGGNFPPQGWATCDGQLLSVAQNSALFSLLGTTYGGDGQTTFALPELRGRVAAHQGNGLTPGALAGSETVTLALGQLPGHTHLAQCADVATNLSPVGQYWAGDPGQNVAPYNSASDRNTLSPMAIIPAGGGQPHDNMQPFLALTFIIALEGVFPSQG